MQIECGGKVELQCREMVVYVLMEKDHVEQQQATTSKNRAHRKDKPWDTEAVDKVRKEYL